MKYSPQLPTHKTIFLTGGAGVVGQALIGKLDTATLLCLVHKKPVVAPNARSVQGDISLPRLGLSVAHYDELARSIDCIIHSAAITDFSGPEDDIMRANVDGTRRLLELAAKADVPFYHVSTAYIYAVMHPIAGHDPNPYEVSKYKADDLVRQSGLPYAIVRPSIILGDARTGMISSFQGFYLMIGLFLKGYLPFLPALPNSYIDFVSQDYVADVLLALIDQGHLYEECWLTAGTQALTISNIIDFCVEQVPRLTGRSVIPPRIVSEDSYQRLIRPVFLPALSTRNQKLLDQAMHMVKYLNMSQHLPSASPTLEDKLNIATMPDPYLTLRSSITYWAKKRGMIAKKTVGRPLSVPPQS